MAPLDFSTVGAAGVLVPLADLKAHLGITDTAHDADVTAIGAAAQEAILAYLAAAADPTWTDQTAPRRVVHAIKILATHYNEHRGDDAPDAARDAEVWAALGRLLAFHRDPTLA
jgi:hypothetical protein